MAASLTKTQSYKVSQWEAQTSGNALTPTLTGGDALWIRQTLSTTDTSVTPTLSSMEIKAEYFELQDPINVTCDSLDLSALVPESANELYFDWGTDTSSLIRTSGQSISSSGTYSETVSGFELNVPYYVRAVIFDGVDYRKTDLKIFTLVPNFNINPLYLSGTTFVLSKLGIYVPPLRIESCSISSGQDPYATYSLKIEDSSNTALDKAVKHENLVSDFISYSDSLSVSEVYASVSDWTVGDDLDPITEMTANYFVLSEFSQANENQEMIPTLDTSAFSDTSQSDDYLDVRFSVFDGCSGVDNFASEGIVVYAPINDDCASSENNPIVSVHFIIQSVYEIGDWVGYRVFITEYVNPLEIFSVETSHISFTESAFGIDENVSVSYNIFVSDSSSISEELLEILKLVTVLDNNTGRDDLLLGIVSHIEDSISAAIENVFNATHAKVRQYTLINDTAFPSNFSNFVDDLVGNDDVGISQLCSVQDFALGNDLNPRGCGAVYEDVLCDENVLINNQIVISDLVLSEDDLSVEKLFTVEDSAFGDDNARGGFNVKENAFAEDNVSIINNIKINESSAISDEATQAFSGLEGDIVIKIANSEGKIRIKRILEFFRSSFYTFKIKDECKGRELEIKKRPW